MRRVQLFEIEDQGWCPATLRDAATDYLQLALQLTNPYQGILPRLQYALEASRATRIVDLCAGGSGPWQRLLPALALQNPTLHVQLTDKYPNLSAWQRLQHAFPRQIVVHPSPVDATAVPAELHGFRTLFTAFHHFPPSHARAILADAVRQRQGIGVFEFTQRRGPAIAGMLLTPLLVWLLTPLIRPLRWQRLLWTYLLPVIPLLVLFDGIVSCLRTYSVEELRALSAGFADDYVWEIGEQEVVGSPVPVTYLLGYPHSKRSADC
jgi:hypothetical protein